MGFRGLGFGGFRGLKASSWVKAMTWTPKVCRSMAPFVGFGPFFYLLSGGLGRV